MFDGHTVASSDVILIVSRFTDARSPDVWYVHNCSAPFVRSSHMHLHTTYDSRFGHNTAAEAETAAAVARARARGRDPSAAWPASFEDGGAAYVLDTASTYFYEASSNAYYDPKSKLYFIGNSWFRHVPDGQPPFEPAVANTGSAAATAGDSAAAAAANGSASESKQHARSDDGRLQSGKKAKLSFGLKAKSSKAVASKRQLSDDLDSGNNSSSDDDTQQLDAEQAKAAELELRRPGRHASQLQQQQLAAKVDSAAAHSGNGHSVFAAPATPVVAAAMVIEHACLLCQRGFASAEQLAKHEAKSKLHAENLAKLSA